jgi:hypothetical protein
MLVVKRKAVAPASPSTDELCERNNNTRRKAVPEGGGLGGELDRKVGKPGALGRAFRHPHRLHQAGALTPV